MAEPPDTQLNYTRNFFIFFSGNVTSGLATIFRKTYEIVSPSWNIIYLRPENLSKMINSSDLPSHYADIHPAHQSDYLRVYLLQMYGGWWMDFSTLVTNNSLLEETYLDAVTKKAQISGFNFERGTFFDIACNLIYAPKGSIVMYYWRKEMEQMAKMGVVNYIYYVYRSGVPFRQGVFRPYPVVFDYFMVNIAWRMATERRIPRRTKIIVGPVRKAQYALLIDAHWNTTLIKQRFLMELKAPKYSVTKLSRAHRQAIWPDLEFVRYFQEPYRYPLTFHKVSPNVQISRTIWTVFFLITLTHIPFSVYTRQQVQSAQMKRKLFP